jgi:LysR family transcriptional regulator, low CO2-responsive transcriptional regulator
VSVTQTQLRSFLAVVRTGSVSAAAVELVVTQPSVSAAVGALARELGVELLERDGRGVRPTPAGLEFAAYAADVVGLLDEGRRAARAAEASHGLRLRIAAVTTAAESFVPPLMQAFSVSHPEVGLSLEVGNRDSVLAIVLGHQADVAIAGRPPPDSRIASHAILVNELVLIAAAGDPLATGRAVAPEELAGRRWLLREPGSGTRLVNEQFLASAGVAAETLTLGSNGAIKQAARAGLGISFVSRDAVSHELESGVLGVIAVPAGPPARAWYAMYSTVGPARPVVGAFMEFIASGLSVSADVSLVIST